MEKYNKPFFEEIESRLLLNGDLLYTPGDANLDDIVNYYDLQAIIVNIGTNNATWEQGDFNNDSIINAIDYIILKNNFGATNLFSAKIENNVLVISGTNQDDSIDVKKTETGTWVNNIFLPENYNSISLFSFGGDDTIHIDYSIINPIEIFAGNGNDTVYENGQGSSYVDGGSGNDLIITIGGESDIVFGGENEDSFWFDSSDVLVDASIEEISNNNVHSIVSFVSPYADEVVSLEINGQEFKDPATPYTYHDYSNYPLFIDGPEYNDILQGNIGDCYYLSSLSGIANSQPNVIFQSITVLGDGTYAVRYFRNGNEVYYRIDADLPGYPTLDYAKLSPDGEIWIALLEKSYCYFRYGQNSYASLNSGWPGSSLTELTNKTTSAIWTGSANLFNCIKSNLELERPVIATSYSTSSNPIVANHAYTVIYAEQIGTDMFITVYNPWGYDGRTWDENPLDGLLRIDIAKFIECFSAICVALF